jgi:hypothetical protein
VRPDLVGDSAYTLESWLLKAYDTSELSDAQIEFNTCLNTARNVVERAFGRLKARFRSVRKQIDMDVLNAPDLILACCCLHNFCEENKEVVLIEWEKEAETDAETLIENARQDRDRLREESFYVFNGPVFDESGISVRRAITNWLDMQIE